MAEEIIDLDEPVIDLDEDVIDLDAPEEKGPLSQMFDEYAAGANELGDDISEGWSDLTREVAPLFKALEPVGEALEEPIDTAVRGIDIGLDVLNRASGTALGTALDVAINPTMDSEIFSFGKYAQDRIAQQQESGNPGEYPLLDKYLPIRLSEDIGYPLGSSIFKNAANGLRSLGLETADDIAYVVDGFAPGAGMATSFMMGANMPIPTFGRLSKVGKAMEKTGDLTGGLAKQISQGQRSVIGLELGGIGIPRRQIQFGSGNRTAAKMFDKVNDAVTRAEVANLYIPWTERQIPNPLRIGKKFLTKSSHEGVNALVENFNMGKNALRYDADELYRNLGMKAKSLGFDLADPAVKKEMYDFFDNPSKFRNTENYRKKERLFNYFDDTLKAEVEANRLAGVPVPTKVFESVDDAATAATLSERYVPRGTSLTKRQQLLAKKKLDTLEDVDKYIAQVSDNRFGGKKMHFTKRRSELNRESMNRYMKQKYDIDDFFHDDFVGAYVDKISDLRNSRIEKELADKLLGTFGKTEKEYLEIIADAKARVSLQRSLGEIPTSDDVFMAALDKRGLSRLDMLPEPVRNRLGNIGAISKDAKGARNLRLPEEIGDYISDLLHKPKMDEVAQQFIGFQNAMKGFMFFNPGYHLRNYAESFSRGISYGAGGLEHAKATTALFRNKGPYTKYLDEFKKLASDTGFFSLLDETGEAMKGTMSVPRGYLSEQNGQKLLMSSMKEIVSKGKWKEFLKDLRSGKSSIRDNPIFKFSTQAGVQGENVSKFAVFSKFREQGYNSAEAIRKVNRIFPDYQITREGIKKSQLAVPFANYFVKNAETTLKILAENPRGAAVFGPQGAFQRSIENWAGFDPERTYKYKDLLGDWADDYIFLGVMPTAESMDRNIDFIKDSLMAMHSELEPGEIIWRRLPSNVHALKQLDPRKLHENWGPLVRATSALIGRDPFTGGPLVGEGTDQQWPERIDAAMTEMTKPMYPQTLMPAVQEMMDNQFGEWRDTLLDAGVSEDISDIIFGSRLDYKKKKARRALSKVKSLWTGGGTQIDLQSTFGAMSRMRDAESYVKAVLKDINKGKRNPEQEKRAFDELDNALDDVLELFQADEEFQGAVERNGGLPDMQFLYEMDDTFGEEEVDLEDNQPEEIEIDEEIDREPQSLDVSNFDRNTELTQQYLTPQGPEKLQPSERPSEASIQTEQEAIMGPPSDEELLNNEEIMIQHYRQMGIPEEIIQEIIREGADEWPAVEDIMSGVE